MKKILIVLLTLFLVMGLFGCTKTSDNGGTGEKLKLGMGISTSLSGTNASADMEGRAQADSTVAVVLVNEKGIIVDCLIDVAQTKMAFTTEGVVSNKDAAQKSKRELGAEYGMKENSEIGLEWDEQAKGFSDYVIGKTVEEVKGIALDDQEMPTDADLKATTTIKIGEFIDAVADAVANAEDLGAVSGDKLGLGIYTTIADSTDASSANDGTAFAYSTYAAVSLNEEDRVSAAVVDATQSKIDVNAKGEITTDLENTKVLSKNMLMEDYNMKARSEIGLEWYEQAKGFAQYLVGKTASEIGGIAIDTEGVPTDEALLATTTITIGDFITASEKAAENAAKR